MNWEASDSGAAAKARRRCVGRGKPRGFAVAPKGAANGRPRAVWEKTRMENGSDAMESLPEVVVALSSWFEASPSVIPHRLGQRRSRVAGSVWEKVDFFLRQPFFIAKRDKDEEIDNVFP